MSEERKQLVLSAVKSMKQLAEGKNFKCCAGGTAIGVCLELGFSGSKMWVYDALDQLVEDGEIQFAAGFYDSVYFVKHTHSKQVFTLDELRALAA